MLGLRCWGCIFTAMQAKERGGEGEVWVDFLSFALSENLGSLRS